MFFYNLMRVCLEQGTNPTSAAEKIGLSPAAATKWKNGSVPSKQNLRKLADLFGVTVEYLLSDDSSTAPSAGDPLSGVSSEDMEYIRKYLALGAKSKIAAQAVIDSLLGTESASRQAIAEDFVATAKEKSEAASNMQHSDFTKR